MEIMVYINENGLTAEGQTPLDILQANLPAITTLPCPMVHWHLVSLDTPEKGIVSRLEKALIPQFEAAVALARNFGFQFGFEHNAPEGMLFSNPEICLSVLRQVSGLGFVWDFNHVVPEKLAEFQDMTAWMCMLHISDTPWPEVNHHLPLGLGNLDLEDNFRALLQGGFSGPAILEIGGLPLSGGYGRDTDEALIASRHRLQQAILNAAPA
jgi:sugar phosphate isomerase/epimerase